MTNNHLAVKGVLEVFKWNLSPLNKKVVVAGGAARDALLEAHGAKATIKDFDLFVLDTPYNPNTVAEIKKCLIGFTPMRVWEWHKSEPYLVTTVEFGGKSVQIMASPYSTIEELLDSFDWEISRYAYDGSYHQGGVDDDEVNVEGIKPGKELELHKVTYPFSTLRRGFRLSERFQMYLPTDTVVSLCKQVVEEHDPTPLSGL